MKEAKTINKLIPFENKDKTWHENEKNTPQINKDFAYMSHPSRGILIAQPNSGKTTMILNLINANNFKRIIIVHNDVTTEEYADIDADILDEIPPIDSEYFDKKVKTLLILEDLNFKNMNKEQKHLLNRMYGTYSTHNNISVWSTQQTPFATSS